MSITLKRAKLLAETMPDVRFFIDVQTSASSGWGGMYPLPIEVVIEHAKDAEKRGYVLLISPFFSHEMEDEK